MTLTSPTCGTVCHHKTNISQEKPCTMMILFSAIPEKFKRCKILKWLMWPRPRPFQGWSVIRRLTLDIAYKLTNLTTLALAIRKIFHGVWDSKIGHMTLTTPLSGRLVVRKLTPDTAYNHTKFDNSSFSRSRDISGGAKFYNASHDPDHAHLRDSWSSEG